MITETDVGFFIAFGLVVYVTVKQIIHWQETSEILRILERKK